MNIEIEQENHIEENCIENNHDGKFKKIIVTVLLIIMFIFFLVVYARFKATTGIKVNEYKITNQSIPEDFHGVKVVQLSDIHFGNTTDINQLKLIVKKINQIKPDIVVFTGDLVEINIDEDTKNSIISELNNINVKLGAYAIKGDSDTNLWNEIIEKSLFQDLNNRDSKIYIGNSSIIISNSDTSHSDMYSIYLLHKPDDVDNLQNNFDLILAGHSLNGQINIPFVKRLLLPDGAKKYYHGHYSVNNSDLYVSSGIGTINFKYRFLNKPSIELYRLTRY